MSAIIQIGKDRIEAESDTTIEKAVRDAGFIPDAFIFAVNGKPVPMDTLITDGMVIKGIKVASGG